VVDAFGPRDEILQKLMGGNRPGVAPLRPPPAPAAVTAAGLPQPAAGAGGGGA
jgi:hypothetical protein